MLSLALKIDHSRQNICEDRVLHIHIYIIEQSSDFEQYQQTLTIVTVNIQFPMSTSLNILMPNLFLYGACIFGLFKVAVSCNYRCLSKM